MPQRIKEEERIERIIRGLLKLPENRRCMNCNNLGPQYVCTTFWTFVCTNCSGIHREFTHRVKSVSMAKFSAEDVAALQAGGNEQARQIYFKAWDPQRNSFPDGSNLHRLRDFIKHVYLDRKYAGTLGNDKFSMIKKGARDDYHQRPSFEASSLGAREDLFEIRSLRGTDHAWRDNFYEQHSFENSIPNRRNDDRDLRYYIDERNRPQSKWENLKSVRRGARTTHFEIVDDRFREDGFGIRKLGSHRHSSEEIRAQSSSPVSQKRGDTASHPRIHPLKDVLGDKASHLRVGEPPKANNVGRSAQEQRKPGSTNNPTADTNEEEPKKVNALSSLIDFDADPETTATTPAVQAQQTAPAGDASNISAPSARNENFSGASNENSLEALLFGLAGPGGESGDTGPPAVSGPSNTNVGTDASRMENVTAFPSNTSASQVKVTDPQQQSLLTAVPAENSSSAAQQANTPEALLNQSLTSEPSHVNGLPTHAPSDQSLQVASSAAQGINSVNESIPSGRRDLPVDLFASSYSSFSTAVPSWQSHATYGMGYNPQFQHSSMASMGAPQDSAKSSNPFDIGDNGPQGQATVFPSMASVQGVLRNMLPFPGLQPQASPYAPPERPHVMMMPPGAYMGQQLLHNMPPSRPQGVNSFGSDDAAFASLSPIHQSSSGGSHDTAFASRSQAHRSSGVSPSSATPDSCTFTRGNPFG